MLFTEEKTFAPSSSTATGSTEKAVLVQDICFRPPCPVPLLSHTFPFQGSASGSHWASMSVLVDSCKRQQQDGAFAPGAPRQHPKNSWKRGNVGWGEEDTLPILPKENECVNTDDIQTAFLLWLLFPVQSRRLSVFVQDHGRMDKCTHSLTSFKHRKKAVPRVNRHLGLQSIFYLNIKKESEPFN